MTTIDAEETATLYLHRVWKLHGLPSHITSGRGIQFMSRFWKARSKQLKIQSNMSTAYHPETDRKTERLNTVMEQYLRCYVSCQLDDWADWQPMAEFAANNQVSITTKCTPFIGNYGFHSRFNYGSPSQSKKPQTLDATKFAKTMMDLQDFLCVQMRTAQDQQEESANTRRLPAPGFAVKTKSSSPRKSSKLPGSRANWTGNN